MSHASNVEPWRNVLSKGSSTSVFVILFVVLSLVTPACAYVKPQDGLLDLANRIEDRSSALQLSGHANGTVTHRLMMRAPWILMFVPKAGLDEDGARKAGVREEDLDKIRKRMPFWSGTAVIVYFIPGGRAIERLPDGVDVERQLALKGNTEEITLTVSLIKRGETTVISSVAVK